MASRRPGRPANHLPAAQALIEDNTLKLTEKALQLALTGDSTMLSALLDRVWPPPAHLPVRLDAAAVRAAVARGLIPADQAAALLELASSNPTEASDTEPGAEA